MKLITFNVNGIRAVQKKGFLDWFETTKPDVLCLQETKAQVDQLDAALVNVAGYQSHWHSAQKKGYSSVAVYTRVKPKKVTLGLGIPSIDNEGRVIQIEFDGFTLLNCYFPNSRDGGARLAYKLEFCDAILKRCQAIVKKGGHVVVTGDFNIAHTPNDLARPKENEETAGYLPEEREWMTQYLSKGYVDTHRVFYEGNGMYTWWSQRTFAKVNNVGWRIDYYCVDEKFKAHVKSTQIFSDVDMSDHCPVSLEIT